VLLFEAGFGTTALNFTAGVCCLLSQPERWQTARADIASIDETVEELLRYSMTTNTDMPRTALDDIEVDGVLIRAGETVAVVPGRPGGDLAGNPDLCRFDPSGHDGHHLAFGHGIHMCLGQHLARLELEVGFEALLRRFPTLKLAEPIESVKWYHRGTAGFDPSAQLMRDPLLVAW
jgi:cytochrome P450